MSSEELASIEAVASMDNWEQIVDFPSDFIDNLIDDKSRGYKLRLAYEELVSNIIRAAGEREKANDHNVSIKISGFSRVDEGEAWLVLQTMDNGEHFDPMFEERTPVDTNQHVNERAIGGLGLFLIKESVDRVSYQWKDGKNIYALWMLCKTSG